MKLKVMFYLYQDVTEATAQRAMEGTTVGIYVARETAGNAACDVGIIIEGVVVLRDLDNVALATALLFGLFYSLNMRHPSQLRSTFEVIQNNLNGVGCDSALEKSPKPPDQTAPGSCCVVLLCNIH